MARTRTQRVEKENEARTLTPEQSAAVQYRGTTCVLSSGAGCGKTTVLTERYLSLLNKDNLGVPQIVAITFTERAAREMRKRIRDKIVEQVKNAKDDDEREKWQRHQQNLDSAPIQTIHAYCSQLLRRFAENVNLDSDVDVLDEAASSVLRGNAVQSSLERLVIEESPIAGELRDLVVLYGWSIVLQSVEKLLAEPDESNWQTYLGRTPESIADSLLNETRPQILSGWLDYLSAANAKLSSLFETMDRIGSPPEAATRTFAEIRQRLDRLSQSDDLPRDLDELNELAKVNRVGTKKQWTHESEYELVKNALSEFRELLKKDFDAFQSSDPVGERQRVVDAIAVSQRFLGVAQVAYREFQAEKRKANALDFNDQIALSRNLLRDNAEVRGRLSRQLLAVMVDEFQDTDPTQMEFVTLLCGGKPTPENLFVVGDEKQSIYRFRGADVDLFRGLRSRVPIDGRLSLSTNYRSRPGVIRFVNALFSRRLSGYEPLNASRPESGQEADVEFLWSFPESAEKIGSAEEIRAREADAIARRILHLQSDESFIVPKNKEKPAHRVRFSDVVILFRSMSHVAIYENALRRRGIDYYLVGGRAFFAQQEVYDLLNVLKAIENPLDGPAVVGVLRSPFCGLSDDAMTIVALHPDGPWAGLFDDHRLDKVPVDDVEPIRQSRVRLSAWREMKDRIPVAQLFETIFADSGYDASTQFEPLADRKLANLWKLLDYAREFDRTQFGPARFLAQLDDLVSRQPREEQAATRPEEDNVVRLMSIHQAKGLEFPIVFVPDIASRTKSRDLDGVRWHRRLGCLARRPFDIKETDDGAFSELPVQLAKIADQIASWQEDLRLLYVACTRAEERLILSAGWREEMANARPTPIPRQGSNHWTMALAERFDLRSGQYLDQTQSVPVAVNIALPELPENDSPIVQREAAEWTPARPGAWSTAVPTQLSLPAWERKQRFDAGFMLQSCQSNATSPHLKLIPSPTEAERALFKAWMTWTPKGKGPNALASLCEGEMGDRLQQSNHLIKDWEWTAAIPGLEFPAVLRGCVPLIFDHEGQTWLVGFDFGTEERDRSSVGVCLTASLVQQLRPDAAIAARLLRISNGEFLPVEIDGKAIESAWLRLRQSLRV